VISSEQIVLLEERPQAAVGQLEKAWDRFARHRLALVGAVVLAAIALVSILAPLLTPYSASTTDLEHITAPPNWSHPLGTDELGRDVLTRILFGGRISLLVGVTSMLIAGAIGITYGSIAGFRGGNTDVLMMRAVDFLLSFPAIFVLLIIASFSRSLLNVILYIGFFSWMGMARLVRGQILTLRERDFTLAARSLGVPGRRIVVRHLLPNALAPVIVAATLGVAGAMLIEAALDFLGFGVPPDTPTWGNLMSNAEEYFTTAPLLAIAPGLVITVAVVCINFIGDALRDALDPFSRRI
jgi:peptide/nickel transport system permease protein